MIERGITIEFEFDPERDQVTEALPETRRRMAELGRRLALEAEHRAMEMIFGPDTASQFTISRVEWDQFHNDATAKES